nr:cationic peroxidase 1 [Quercus suber]
MCPGVVLCVDIVTVAARDSVVGLLLVYNETNIDSSFTTSLQSNCPSTGGDSNLAPLDVTSSESFDNEYFKNLISKKGLLPSNQQLFNEGSTNSLVNAYSTNSASFLTDFANAMLKIGELSPLTGLKEGERLLGRRRVTGSKECEGSPVRRKANGHQEGEGSPIRMKVNGRREGEGLPIRRKPKGCQFEGMRRVAVAI